MGEQRRQAKRISQPPAPPAAPSEPGVDLVVVSEWTGGLATALRRARRDNLYDFASYLGVGASTADDWAKNPAIVPRSATQRALDRALRGASFEVRKRFGMLVRGKRAVELPDSLGLEGNGGDTNRNQALKALGGLVAAVAVPEEVVERLVGDRAGRVDAGLLDSYERVARALAVERLADDARAVVPVALANAGDALGLLGRPVADRRRLDALVAGVNARAGLWAFFDGDLRAARKHLSAAWGLAAESGDLGLLTQAVGMSAILHSALPWGGRGGDPERAIELLDQAGALAVHADPHTRLWVPIWRADEVAAVGDARACRASVDAASRARELLGDDPDAGGRIGYLVWGLDQQLESVRATAEVLAGRFADAERRLEVVLGSAVNARHEVNVLAQVGRVRVGAGEPEGACEALASGLDRAEPAGYAMGVERVRGVRDHFPKQWRTLSCVRRLDDRLGAR